MFSNKRNMGSSGNTTEYYRIVKYNATKGIVTFPAGHREIYNGLQVYYDAYLYYIDCT